MFQSSPTPKGGRYNPQQVNEIRLDLFQSLAHPERWALHECCQVTLRSLVERFQSSPTPKGGRYPSLRRMPWLYVNSVSILAHPERWALPHRRFSLASRSKAFQSSPTPKGGRYNNSSGTNVIRSCFNPRPPRKVGATVLARDIDWLSQFQSSPTPKGGRYPGHRAGHGVCT